MIFHSSSLNVTYDEFIFFQYIWKLLFLEDNFDFTVVPRWFFIVVAAKQTKILSKTHTTKV